MRHNMLTQRVVAGGVVIRKAILSVQAMAGDGDAKHDTKASRRVGNLTLLFGMIGTLSISSYAPSAGAQQSQLHLRHQLPDTMMSLALPTVTSEVTLTEGISTRPVADGRGGYDVASVVTGHVFRFDAKQHIERIPGVEMPTSRWGGANGPLGPNMAVGSDGTLYIVSDAGNVRAVVPLTGHVLWSIDLGGHPLASPVLLANNTVNILTADEGGVVTLHGLFLLDGTTQRTTTLGPMPLLLHSTLPSLNGMLSGSTGSMLYIVDGQGTLHAIGEDRELWSFAAFESIFNNPSQYPQLGLIADSGLRGQMESAVSCTVLSSGLIVLTSLNYGVAVAVTPDGHLAWAREVSPARPSVITWANPVYVSPPVAAPNGKVLYVSSWVGTLAAVTPTGRFQWISHDPVVTGTSTLVSVDSEGYLYVGTIDGRLLSINARDGGHRWQLSLPLSSAERVVGLTVTLDNSLVVATAHHIFVISNKKTSVLPLTIIAYPATKTRVYWTWKWTGGSDHRPFWSWSIIT